ncbi:DNA repair protein [Sulfitobacter litoralis]|uniref:DNA repair protein n=1 Tax=Sulfitobacter litoralis TaxID=335975 RepID=UPI002B275B50|nr:DNA repair protein [Sulfitobacter litoralis]
MNALTALIQYIFQRLAVALFAIAAVAIAVSTVMAALGLWAWVELPISYAGEPVENAGMYAQIGLAFLAVGLCFFLPTNRRVMQLETSHRQFSMNMDDVTRAYGAVHAADRGEVFQMSSEFDSVRERLAYLRDHPDLSTLEPALLEVAAQMSHISRELATVYADEKIERARNFLKERQEEVNLFNSRLDQAKGITTEMKHWLHEVELEESVAAAQLDRLRAEMREIMPELGIDRMVTANDMARDSRVVELPPKAAE